MLGCLSEFKPFSHSVSINSLFKIIASLKFSTFLFLFLVVTPLLYLQTRVALLNSELSKEKVDIFYMNKMTIKLL